MGKSEEQILEQPKPELLIDLVKYQAGAVVSRALVKEDVGNVTLFAFEVGEELSEHSTPFHALIYFLDGKAEVTIAGSKYILNEGQIINLPANKTHAIRAISAFKMLLIMIKSKTE